MYAGEWAYELDKVNCFHDAVLGYAPFLFELNSHSSSSEVQAAYKKVFAKLKVDPRLPEKYEDSARHLLWFEEALDSHGSTETSSIETASKINNSGEYIVTYAPVSNTTRKVIIKTEDAVKLQYKEAKTEEIEKMNLDELRELLSRLMLIAGKDRQDIAESVSFFTMTFQYIEWLASSYVALYNAGCPFFNTWSVRIKTKWNENISNDSNIVQIKFGERGNSLFSNSCETIVELSSLCIVMESIKTKWEDYVFAMRCQHPVLNEFNIQQLSTLCSGLTKKKREQHCENRGKRNTKQAIDESVGFCLDTIKVTKNTLIKFLDIEFKGDAQMPKNEDDADSFVMSGQLLTYLAKEMEKTFSIYLSRMKSSSQENYLNLFHLGDALTRCLSPRQKLESSSDRKYPEHLKQGSPNLVVCDKRVDIILYILSLYNYVSSEELPNHKQVLMCNEKTSVSEMEIFLLRAMSNYRNKVYSMAFADDLSQECADKIEKLIFEKIKNPHPSYKLIVFNYDENSQVSRLLEKFKTKLGKESEDLLRTYLCGNLISSDPEIGYFRLKVITSNQPSSGTRSKL